MIRRDAVVRLGLVGVLLVAPAFGAVEEEPSPATASEAAGTVERAALAEMAFLAGDWAGEGWSIGLSGERRRFWVEEEYRYRGDGLLMDMEGRFGGLSEDGARQPQGEYGLGFLYFDRAAGEYRMWHYGSEGEAFTVTMAVDTATRTMHYTRTFPESFTGRFHLRVGDDGVWTSRFDILQPDGSWKQHMEFRMERVEGR